jgi:hypothetical protein
MLPGEGGGGRCGMAGKKRIIIAEEILKKIIIFKELKTQDLRVRLIADLEKLFRIAKAMAETAENREDWIRVAGFIAQTINGLAKSYDETRFNEEMKELEMLIEQAKKRAGKIQTGTPVT